MPGVVRAYVEESRNQERIDEARAYDPMTTEVEAPYRGAARRVGEARRVMVPREAELNAELARSTNEFLARAWRRAADDRVIERDENRQVREAYAASGAGGWVPGNPTDAQRQEWREDHERRRGWNGLIKGGTVNPEIPEPSLRDVRAPAELTKPEIVAEARELHANFNQLLERFEVASGAERAELRDQMKPLAIRENELRDEYFGRVKAEMNPSQLTQERAPAERLAYSR